MKKIFLILVLILGSNYAMPKNSNAILIRGRCDILYDNVYTYCVGHGYSDCESQELAVVAFNQCKGMSNSITQ